MKPLAVLLVLLLLSACSAAPQLMPIEADTTQTDTTQADAARSDPAATLLSAFYGLDNGLPLPSNLRLCRGAGNADGMPVIFSHQVDVATVQAGDFRVIRQSGAIGAVTCVTFAPAIDDGELRTALLVGEFGSAADPPLRVQIGGHLLSIDGSFNFKDAQVAVTPLDPGPTLVLAERVPEAQWKTGFSETRWSVGSGCLAGATQVLRAVWAGGITLADDSEPTDRERMLYQVRLAQPDGSELLATPFALADLGDGDNNHLLCLDVAGTPLEISFPAGYFTDPNDDLNPATTIRFAEPHSSGNAD